ncbi:uncharacterized protein LOC135941846 [Cloeon dipterum]|uniref:uncharacterized protein LOC135941846 n=1 Tax=Cloeon dipterum TaxID=197152 RepID=UPI00321F7671
MVVKTILLYLYALLKRFLCRRDNALEEILKKGEKEGRPNEQASLGFFKTDGQINIPANDVFVLVVHYDFENQAIAREGDSNDVQNLKTTFGNNRNCNFRDLKSPKKEHLLDILGDQKELLRFFSSKDPPDVFLLFVLSHGYEDGIIYTDHLLDDQKTNAHFTTDEVFDSIKKLTKFEKCLKLINFGPCRGELPDPKFNRNKEVCEETYKNRNASRITFTPAIHNLVVFYSTVETTLANRNELGSWFVQKYCDCLNQTEEKPLLTFLSMVQNKVHFSSMPNLNTRESLGQTPELKMFSQDREFFISRSLIAPVTFPNTDGKMVKPGSNTTYSKQFTWKSDEGQNIRGRNAFILYEKRDEQVEKLVKSVRNLDFETRLFQLNKLSLDSYLKICSELEHDVGCILTCIFGEVSENDAKEVCILVGQEKKPLTDILHSFVGPKNAKWIGKPKIFVLINQEASKRDTLSPEGKFDISATNHSGWLVLILKDKDLLEKLIRIFKSKDLKKGKSLQEMLYSLLISESKKNKVLLNSTLQYLLDFPDWPRTFVSQSFRLRENDSSKVNTFEFDETVREAKKSFDRGHVWLMSSVAGSGKTTVLKEIAYQLGKSNPELKILYISLKKHSLTILNKPTLNQFLASATFHSTDDIKRWIEEKKAIVFFDGFDEIDPHLREKVITLFHSLKGREVSMFIATRPHEAEIIKERIVCDVLVGVEPLNEEKQINFLKIVTGKNEEECKQFLTDFEEKDILENSLHLSLLASIRSEGNLYQIYAKVVEKKLELCLLRDGYNIDDSTNFRLKMALASIHLQLIALRFLRNENLIGRGISREDLEKMNDYGVATVLDGEVTFLHQTFAEFLATKQFLDDFNLSQLLDSALFQDSTSAQCRKFLDLFYCTQQKEKPEDLGDHVEALLAVAKSIGPNNFLKKVLENNLRQVFLMIKPRISFHANSNSSICMEKSPELLMSAIGNEQIAVQLLEMGIVDKSSLEQILPDLLRNIEENNSVVVLEKFRLEFADLPLMIEACYSNDSETSKNLKKVGFTAIRNDFDIILEMLIQIGIRAVDAFDEEENSLFAACRYGSVKCFRVLLKHGAQKVIYGSTLYDPLNVATEFGHLDLLKFLMEENPSLFKRDESTLVLDGLQDIWNPFQYAIMYGRKEIATYFLSKCPGLIESKTKDGKNPMQLAAIMRKWEVLEWLAQLPNTDIKSLIPDGESVYWTQFELENYEHFLMLQGGVKEKDKKGRSVLHYAAKYGYTDLVAKFIEAGADIEATDVDGWNALHFACLLDKNIETIKLLHSRSKQLAKGKTSKGQTALHILAQYCNPKDFGKAISSSVDIARFLFEDAGVDLSAKDNEDDRASGIADERGLDKSIIMFLRVQHIDPSAKYDLMNSSVIFSVSEAGDLLSLQQWIQQGGDLSMRDESGRTALQLVEEKGEFRLMQKKNETGQNMRFNEQERESSLLLACKQKNWDKVKNLLESKNSSINRQDKDGRTALHYAAEEGHFGLVFQLLSQRADMHVKDHNGWTALHYAILTNNKDLVQMLLESGAEIDSKTKRGETALHLAAYKGSTELTIKLIQCGADVNSKNNHGLTCLNIATVNRNLDLLEVLLKNKADVNNEYKLFGNTPLHHAALENYPEILEMLVNHGADVNLQNKNGWTALHLAARYNPELSQTLLDHGADVNSKEIDAWTPLLLAARFYPELSKTLLNHGADVNSNTKMGSSPLHFAARYNPELSQTLLDHGADINSKEIDAWTPLHFAARYNPELSQTLLDHGADINSKEIDAWTPLHFAARYNPELSQTLLDHGADVNSKEIDAWTPLHFAARYNPDLSQTLLDHGAYVNSNTKMGSSPLHFAARYNPELSQKLLDHGADVYLENREGWTALHVAARYNPKLALKLIDHAIDADILESKFKNEWTALHLAMEINCPESVQKLPGKGADVNLQNGDGSKALQLAKVQNYRALEEMLLDQRIFKSLKLTTGTSALTLAIESNNLTVAENLINNGGDLTVRDKNGRNILLHALKNFEMVKYLHEKNGELVKQVTNDGSTYLHLAIDNDDCPFEVILWLIEEIKIDANATNEFGETAFMMACSKNRSDVVEYLLTNKDIDLSNKDRGGRTALHHAVTSGCVDLVQNLLDRGADLRKKDDENRNVMFYGLKSKEMILYLNRKNSEFIKAVDTLQNTLLLYAIEFFYMVDRDVVHWLINESGIDLNAVDDEGNSAFIVACMRRKWDFVETLLTKDVDIQVKDEEGKNPLHYAAESGYFDLVQKLIERGVNPTLKDNLGKNTMHYALQHLDIVKSLDRELAKEVTKDKNTSLHIAIGIYDYSIEVIRWLLDEAQVDVNAKNLNGETALMIACSKNRFEVIQILVEKKADVSIQDNKGRTALHHAARSGHLDLVKILFDHMASEKDEDGSLNIQQTLVELVKHVDKEDNTLLVLAMESSEKFDESVISWLVDNKKLDLNAVNCNGESALLLACKHRKWDAVDILLSREDTIIGSKDQKERTPLHWAAFSGNLDVVQMLVERGADLTLKDSDGMNVMHHALKDLETVKFLHNLNKGLVTEITKNGSTCFHLAVIRGSPEVIRWLVDEGIEVDLDKSNELGLTALLLACRKNMWEVVEFLVDNKVDITKSDRAGKTVLNYAKESDQLKLVELLNKLSAPNSGGKIRSQWNRIFRFQRIKNIWSK